MISVSMDELVGYNASFWRDAAPHLCRKVIRPVFDSIWNAAGWPRSMNYDEAGSGEREGIFGMVQNPGKLD